MCLVALGGISGDWVVGIEIASTALAFWGSLKILLNLLKGIYLKNSSFVVFNFMILMSFDFGDVPLSILFFDSEIRLLVCRKKLC